MSSDFLRISTLLYDSKDVIEIRPLPVGKAERRWVTAGDLEKVMPKLEKENKAGANLYFGVLPRVANKGTADDCLPGKAVWADIDDGCTPQDAWRRATSNGLPDPSIVINSGHGTHLYWVLTDKATPQQITGVVSDIITVLGSDPSVKDAARIMRIPGFTNWKEPVAESSLVYLGPARYAFEQLRSSIVISSDHGSVLSISETGNETNADRARKYVAKIPGKGKGGRTTGAYRVAAILVKDYRLTDSEALDVLAGWDSVANNPPIQGDPTYGPGELERIIHHARNYGKKPDGCKADQLAVSREMPAVVIPVKTSASATRLFDEIDAQESGLRTSIDIPWTHLNKLSKPLRPGSVLLVAGPVKVGKSYMLTNMAIHCDRQSVPWRYLPLEDDWNDFAFRVLACLENDYDMTNDDATGAAKRREALCRHGTWLDLIMANVNENPRLGVKDKNGNTVIPEIHYSTITAWVREALKKSRIVFVDPLSQIESQTREQHKEESRFIRELLAIAKDSQGTIVLSAHTIKRPGAASQLELTAEDVQGSSMLTRLAHTVLIINGHETKESDVRDQYGARAMQEHNRTIYIAAARNGSGTRSRMAFTQRLDGPSFDEHGLIQKEKEKRRR